MHGRLRTDREAVELALVLLQEARTTIASPKRWTQKVSARNEAGLQVLRESSDAVAWDVDAALLNAADKAFVMRIELPRAYIARALPKLRMNNGHLNVMAWWKWHDAEERTHAEVLQVLDEALAICSADMAKATIKVRRTRKRRSA